MTGIPPRTWCLADQVIDGKPRKLVLHADRNGFFYVLDRTNGKFLFAKPFVRQTWNMGFDAGWPADHRSQILGDVARARWCSRPSAAPTSRRRPTTPEQGPFISDLWRFARIRRQRAGGERAGQGISRPRHRQAAAGTRARDRALPRSTRTTGKVRWKFPCHAGLVPGWRDWRRAAVWCSLRPAKGSSSRWMATTGEGAMEFSHGATDHRFADQLCGRWPAICCRCLREFRLQFCASRIGPGWPLWAA